MGGPICGVPIGFGVTTTAGGLNPYTTDIYGGGLGLGAGGIPPLGLGGLGGGLGRGGLGGMF